MNIRMGTKGKRPLRSLTPRDKIHAIQRIHDGESKASVARDIGVPESTLRGWCKNEDKLRFMSRQSAADKMCADALADKLDGAAGHLLGPPEKRQRLDNTSLPLNFSNKMNFDELAFKRSPLNGLDYSTNKSLADMNYNGLPVDYVGFNGAAVKNKVFGADISRPGQTDPSLNAISPLSSLTHLSGLTGISQSPLAISFNELTSNLNLLAQLNPGLAAMSGLNSFAATANTLRQPKPPAQANLAQVQSPRSDNGERERERTPALSVKNWAKQKTPGDCDPKSGSSIKSPSPSLAPSLVGCVAPLSGLPDDPLLYWLKSQQAMLGLNSLYPPPPPVTLGVTSPPIRSSTPQQQLNQFGNTPPIPSAPLTPSSTPSGSLDDKNTAWYNWCKAFGASLHSLNPNLAALQANSLQHQAAASGGDATQLGDIAKPPFENILYSQLTKETVGTPSVRSLSSNEQQHTDPENDADADGEMEAEPETENELEAEAEGEAASKPEDLSAKSVKTASSATPSPTLISPSASRDQSPEPRAASNPHPQANIGDANSVGEDCKSVLNNIIYKIGGNAATSTPHNTELDSEMSFNSDSHHHNNNDVSESNNNTHNNNNNNSNKTDEEERAKFMEMDSEDIEEVVAIKHGEKFLQWLENCSNPRVTAVQLMQLRFLIAAIKSSSSEATTTTTTTPGELLLGESEDNDDAASRNKSRRRK
ncbi:protein distal antenna [Drosophila albomicans]|uniref:Protein distal antenna n=1 Tax=Drosophila albomicans TaxID=7291 RepID=A0A6P8XUL4_DROAB|nr:protein distal antenna [Drosophila albomicans]